MPGSVWPSTDATATARAGRVRGGPRLQTGLRPRATAFYGMRRAVSICTRAPPACVPCPARACGVEAIPPRLKRRPRSPSAPGAARGGQAGGTPGRRIADIETPAVASTGPHRPETRPAGQPAGQSGRFDAANRTAGGSGSTRSRRRERLGGRPRGTAAEENGGPNVRRGTGGDSPVCYKTDQVAAMAKVLLSATAASESVSSSRGLRETTSTKTAHARAATRAPPNRTIRGHSLGVKAGVAVGGRRVAPHGPRRAALLRRHAGGLRRRERRERHVPPN